MLGLVFIFSAIKTAWQLYSLVNQHNFPDNVMVEIYLIKH